MRRYANVWPLGGAGNYLNRIAFSTSWNCQEHAYFRSFVACMLLLYLLKTLSSGRDVGRAAGEKGSTGIVIVRPAAKRIRTAKRFAGN